VHRGRGKNTATVGKNGNDQDKGRACWPKKKTKRNFKRGEKKKKKKNRKNDSVP